MPRHLVIIVSICLFLSACGDTRIERAGSGAVAGAVVGYGAGYLSGPAKNTEPGLFIGIAVGAIIGYLLDEPIFFNYRD